MMASTHRWLQLSLPIILQWYKEEELLALDLGFWHSLTPFKGSPCSLPWWSKGRFPLSPKDEGMKIPTSPPGWYPGLSKGSLDRKYRNEEGKPEGVSTWRWVGQYKLVLLRDFEDRQAVLEL